MDDQRPWADRTAAEVRAAVRAGKIVGPTAGMAQGFVQTNLVVLPGTYALEFTEFCRQNPQACPLVAMTQRGGFEPLQAAPGADLRTDVPRYRVFRKGVAEAHEPTDVRKLWRDDLVGFLLGCSFTFETALTAAGLPPRHVVDGRNVPMFRTNLRCVPAGGFSGPLVVSMRPYAEADVAKVIEITSHFPRMHGAPVHVGDPASLGIADLTTPDFGEAVAVLPGEVPVFWACGVTPQLALENARPDLALTHSPGCMFLTDLRDAQFYEPLLAEPPPGEFPPSDSESLDFLNDPDDDRPDD